MTESNSFFSNPPAGGLLRDALVGGLRARTTRPDSGLEAAGWVDPAGRFTRRAGALFASDVGGTKVQSVLTDLNGTVLGELRAETPLGGGGALLDLVAAHCDRLVADTGMIVRAAGIGLPGAIHPRTGHLDRAPNLVGLEGHDMRILFAERLGLPVAVENDVNLAALGESWLGHGAALKDTSAGLIFLSLGTGIGMGLAWGDRLSRGASGAAGEIAALPIGANPRDPRTHRCGALESVVSGAALLADYQARGGCHTGKSLRDISRNHQDDHVYEQVIEGLGENAALAILAVEAILNPAMVVLGGGIGSQPVLLEHIVNNLAAMMPMGMPIPDCRSSLLGNRAGVLGGVRAARLCYAESLGDQYRL